MSSHGYVAYHEGSEKSFFGGSIALLFLTPIDIWKMESQSIINIICLWEMYM